MKDITKNFGTLYHPKSALLFFTSEDGEKDAYVESYDINGDGMPVNAHPLTVREARTLAKMLKVADEKKQASILKPTGIIGNEILYFDAIGCRAIWYTKKMQKTLYFIDRIGIPQGTANIPPLLWVADRHVLRLFALGSNRRPSENTKLYHAPFFNVHSDGAVCMGTVDINIKRTASLEEFTTAWEDYFFNSYFSHLMQNHNPINGNCVLLWQELVETGKPFPMEVLKKNNRTLKNLIP